MRLVEIAQDIPHVGMAQHLHRGLETRRGIHLAQEDDRIRIQSGLFAHLRDRPLAETAVDPEPGQHAEQAIIGLHEIRNLHITGKLVHIHTKIRKKFLRLSE